jgi:hypothetical protein
LEGKLTEAELRRLVDILPPGAAAGDRYHAAGMQTING